jgi:hypothetical protein
LVYGDNWLACRVQNTAADWIEANLGQGPVVKEKFMSSSNWSSAVRHTASAAASCCRHILLVIQLDNVAAADGASSDPAADGAANLMVAKHQALRTCCYAYVTHQ